MSIQTYLVLGESIVLRATDLTVDGEKKYDGYVTNRRIIFLKENKFKDILHNQIVIFQFERRRRFGIWMLLLGIVLLLFFFLVGILSVAAGILLMVVWTVAKREDLVIYLQGRGRIMVLRGDKENLQQIVERRSQLARAQIPQTASLTPQQPIIIQQPSQTTIIKEVVMIPCKYCGALMPQSSTYCSNCGAPRR